MAAVGGALQQIGRHDFVLLSLKDHKKLLQDLHELAPQWRIFGIYLGVPIDKLDGLQGEASMVDRCFVSVLVMWLNGGGSVEQLIKALRSPGVNHGRLAAEIERKRSGELFLQFLRSKAYM